MKRTNVIFLIVLTVVLIIFASCIAKIDRTFGPISINITSSSNPIMQGNTVTLTASLGFGNYSWQITSTNTYGCTIKKISDSRAQLSTGYSLIRDTYLITIKVSDDKNNSTIKDFIITKPIVILSKNELNSTDNSDSITVEVKGMPNFDHFAVSDPATVTFSDSTVNPTVISGGTGVTGTPVIYAVSSDGQTSVHVPFIVYFPAVFDSVKEKDGYVSYYKNINMYSSNSDDTVMYVGNDTGASTIFRSFFSFYIPSGMPETSYKAIIHLVKVDEHPANLFENNKIFMRYIGSNTINDSLTNRVVLFSSLNADIDDPDNHYYDLKNTDANWDIQFVFSPVKNSWLFNRLYEIGSGSGGYFDLGLRLYDESSTNLSVATYLTNESGWAPFIEIRFY